MNTEVQSQKIETLFAESIISTNQADNMMNTEEQKIERPFTESIIPAKAKTITIKKAKSNKIETKIDESIITINQADTIMNTETEIITAPVVAPKVKKPRTKKIVVEEEAPVIVAPEPDALMVDGIDTSAEEQAYKEAVEEDEETQLKRRLAEIQAGKKAEKVRENIGELRATLKTYQQGLIAKAEEDLAKLKQQLADVDTGVFDEDLIAKALRKAPIKINADGEVVKKNAGVAGEGENRARAVRKLNDDDAKEKKMLSAFTKRVGEYRWGLHRGGTITAKDKKGVYSMPLWKEQNATMVVEGENSFKTIKEFKEWILENNK